MKILTAVLVAVFAALMMAGPVLADGGSEHYPQFQIKQGHLTLGSHNTVVREAVTNWDYATGYTTEVLFGRGVQPFRIDFIGSPAPNGTGSGGENYLEDIGGNDEWLRVCGDMAGDRVDAARAWNRQTNSFMKVTVLSGPVGRCGSNSSEPNREYHQGGSVYAPLGGPRWDTAHWVGPKDWHT